MYPLLDSMARWESAMNAEEEAGEREDAEEETWGMMGRRSCLKSRIQRVS